MSMDRAIERRYWTLRRIIMVALIIAVAVALIWLSIGVGTTKSYRVSRANLVIATVTSGQFQDDLTVLATVEPAESVVVNIMQGGTVDEIFFEEGAIVEAGDPLVRFNNPSFELAVLQQEGTISEQINLNSETRLRLDQSLRDLRNQLTDIDYEIDSIKRDIERRKPLLDDGHISTDEMDRLLSDLDYQQERRSRTLEDIAAEESVYDQKIAQLDENDKRAELHLQIVRESLRDLTVRAPISGQLIDMDVTIGERAETNTSLGRIDNTDEYILMAQVDEFYIGRVAVGQDVSFNVNDQRYSGHIDKVFPQVTNGTFEVRIALDGAHPAGLRRGASLQVTLVLGASSESLLLENGSFHRDTGGRWAFVLDPSGEIASPRDIRLGRRNDKVSEVLEGLAEGDRVVTSSYAGITDMERLIISD